MNWLELWTQTSIAKALGWTLLHSLWEGAAVAALLAGALCLFRSPRARYAAACLSLMVLLAGFAITLASLWPASKGAAAPHLSLTRATFAETGPLDATPPVRLRPADLLPWIAPIWIAGVVAFHLRALAGWLAARRLRRSGVCCAPSDWDARLARLASRLRISHPVSLLESSLADTPLVIAHLRPVILVPVGLLAGLPPDQVEAILAHELAHILRRDYLVNLLQTFVEGLFFYHPAVWWVSRVISAERENCCDDIAIAVCGDARSYAAALAALEQNRFAARELALAATGGRVVDRIRRILKDQERTRIGLAPLAFAIVLSLATAVCLAAWQTAPARLPSPEAQAAPVAPVAAAATAAQAPPAPAPTAMAASEADPAPQTASADPSAAAQQLSEPLQQLQQLRQLSRQTEKERKRSLETADALPTPYRKWLTQDVAYIISDDERAAFKSLETDTQREAFIEQFWLKRDPTPGTPENEFKDEHYRRIAYANEHFASGIPGWKTDRGRIYITYGPPDEIEDHSSGGLYRRPPEEGGGETQTVPFQQWRYRYIEGVGNNVIIEFVDPTYTHEYRMTMDPWEKDALKYVTPPANSFISVGGDPQVTIDVGTLTGAAGATVQFTIQQDAIAGQWEFLGKVMSGSQQAASFGKVMNVDARNAAGRTGYVWWSHLGPGSYTFNVSVKDPTGATRNQSVAFYVN
jgi:GWxTD domain-containing protein